MQSSILKSILLKRTANDQTKISNFLKWVNSSHANMQQVFNVFQIKISPYIEMNENSKELKFDKDARVQFLWVNTRDLDHWCVLCKNSDESIIHFFDSMKNEKLFHKIKSLCDPDTQNKIQSQKTSPVQKNDNLCFIYCTLYVLQRYNNSKKDESTFYLTSEYAKKLLFYLSKKLKKLPTYRATKHRKLITTLLKKGHPHKCFHCQKSLSENEMTLEHLCSKSCGGSDHLSNLRISCAQCNNERANCCRQDCNKKWPIFPSDSTYVHMREQMYC